MAEEGFDVVLWEIQNFSFWNKDIHGENLIAPKPSDIITLTLGLFPRGRSGSEEHLVVCIYDSCGMPFSGDVSFMYPDDSIVCTQQIDSKGDEGLLPLPPGPKFKDVVARRVARRIARKDTLTLKFRFRSDVKVYKNLKTVIDVFENSLNIVSKILEHLISAKKIWLKVGSVEIILSASKDQLDGSKLLLTLQPKSSQRKVLIFSYVSVLRNGNVVRTEERWNLCRNESDWTFLNSLTIEEVKNPKFCLVLKFKIISSKIVTHINAFSNSKDIDKSVYLITSDEFLPPCISFPKERSPTAAVKSEKSETELATDFLSLYQNQEFSDFELRCNKVTFPVHRIILSARSPVFKTMLSTEMKEASTGCMDIVDMEHSTLASFLYFLYTGTVEELQGERALNLYYAADKFQVPSLKKECTDFLMNNVTLLNVCDIMSLADKHRDDQLTSVAHDFFLKNYNEVLRSEEWKSFMEREPLLAVKTVTHFGEKNYVSRTSASTV